LLSLAAVVVREKYEAALIDTAKQYHARRRPAVGSRRGQSHAVRLRQVRGQGLVQPDAKLSERVRIQVVFAQSRGGMLPISIGQNLRVAHPFVTFLCPDPFALAS